ncbi:M23 family metallopeptidase [Corynebacterium sp. sy039]|uniref:M23 family metallopeptidase n=1 Tax=Corynebacterium sp. sy039 TaxID=2599641 RepID=UPI0011B3FB1D|nr:M23 family metallopeptidase [Corynebacterium sp. sy039]QDZ42227.1 M23 family metallopeptidase [Corynebacterium sp. sy039]
MQSAQRTTGGKHRKQNTSSLKNRISLMTLVASALSISGATGAAIAQSHTKTTDKDAKIALAAHEGEVVAEEETSPQILSIAEFKPNTNLSNQLTKAVQYSEERAVIDELIRIPKVTIAKPADGILTTLFEFRWGAFHTGIDIANASGTPIYAVMDGTVIDSGPASGYGQWIRIRHDDGSISVYGHMETLDVSVGERVVAGQQIAGMGSLGFSTGPHLHFEIHPDGSTPADPIAWLEEHGVSF